MPRVSSTLGRRPSSSTRSIDHRPRRRRRAAIDWLESRCLLTITLTGVPNWLSEGPAPINNAQLNALPNSPATGGVESIAIDPFNNSEIFAGTVNGGIWRTMNADPANPGAISWMPLTDRLPSLSIGSVAFDPIDTTGNTVFAGTGSFSNGFDGSAPAGVYLTTDGGNSWSVLAAATFQNQRIKTILPTAINVGPGLATNEVVLAGTIGNANTNWTSGGGLYESMDNGKDFTLQTGNGLPAGSVTSLIVDPNNASQFFAAIPGSGIYRGLSNAAGVIMWSQVNTGVTNIAGSSVITLTAHAAGGTVLYAGVATGNTINGVFSSSNAGGAWTALATPPAPNANFQGAGSLYDEKLHLVADPVANNVVYLSGEGTDNIFRYDPTGAGNWVMIVDAGAMGGTVPHADSRALAFLNTNGNATHTLIDLDDGGVYFMNTPTDAAHNSWQSFIGNLGVTEFVHLTYDTNANLIFAGAQDNGSDIQTATGSTVWQQLPSPSGTGDGGYQAYDAVNSIRYNIANNLAAFYRNNASILLRAPGNPAQFSGLNAADHASVTNNLTSEDDPFILNSVDPTRMLIGRTGLYESASIASTGDDINDITPSGMTGTVTALAYGGTRAGTNEANVAFVGTNTGQLFYRGETGSTFTSITVPGGGGITGIALDPQDWRRVYVIRGSSVFVTNNVTDLAHNAFQDLTNNLENTTLANGRLTGITLFDNTSSASGDSIPIVSGLHGVYRLLGSVWTQYGAALPNTVVDDVKYIPGKDLLIAATFGRGAWEVSGVSTTIKTTGVLTITGDMDFPNENDTIKLVLEAGNPTLLDVYLNSATPTETFQLSTIQKIVVDGLGGNDQLIVDRTNGDPVPVGGLTYDGGTHTPPGVDMLTVVGAGASLATFTRDPVTPDAGTLVVDGSTITFTNSQLTTIGNVAQLTILGSNAANGIYSPDPATADAGTFVVGAATIKFSQVGNSTVSDVTTFAMIAPNAPLIAKISSPFANQEQVFGLSGTNAFTPLIFFNIVNFTLDARSTAVGPQGDSITINGSNGPALVASELENFTVDTGAGNDVLTINADDLRLPVAGGLFTYDAGTGLFPDGSHESNLRGLTSLDRVVVNADRDMTIADLPHQLVGGGPIPDDTPPQVDLSMAQGGSGLGLLTMFGVEVASLNGGASANVIEGSAFSGALIINGGGGDDTLTGGSGNNTIISGAGNSTLTGGNHRADGATNNILGGGGVNVLIAGPGTNRLIAGSGTTTMIGGIGQDTFIIPNPAGTLSAPIGGYEIIGAGNPGDVLQLQGGGNPDVTEVYTVGPLPDPTAPETVATTNALGLIVPTIEIPSVRFDGEISLATSFHSTAQPVTESIRYSGLGTILDGVRAGSMFVHSSAGAGTLAVDPSSNLTAGKLDLTEGGTAVASILFGNKGMIGVYGPGGVTLASRDYQTPLPIVFSPAASLADSTTSAPPSKLASSIVSAGPGGSPFVGPEPDLATAEVAALYRVILGRAADSAGLTAAVAMVQHGAPLARVASGLIHSDEHAADAVGAEYRAYLGRSASAGEIQVGVAAFRGGLTERGLAAGLLGSTEYGFDHPGDIAFVAATYLDTLGRPASSSEVAAVSGLLAGGMSRGSVIDSLLGSTEALTRAVDGLYLAILGRDADAAGSSAAVRALQSGPLMLDDLADQLAGSAEFSTQAKASVR